MKTLFLFGLTFLFYINLILAQTLPLLQATARSEIIGQDSILVDSVEYFYNSDGSEHKVQFYRFEEILDSLILFRQTKFDYFNDTILRTVTQTIQGSQVLTNISRDFRIFGPFGRESLIIGQIWDNTLNEWKNVSRYTSESDQNSRDTLLLYQTWDEIGAIWRYTSRIRIVPYHNPQQNVFDRLVDLREQYDSNTSQWIFSSESRNEFDSLGNQISRIDYSSPNIPSTRRRWTYNSLSQLLSTRYELYDETDQAWDNISLSMYSYQGNGPEDVDSIIGYRWIEDQNFTGWSIRSRIRHVVIDSLSYEVITELGQNDTVLIFFQKELYQHEPITGLLVKKIEQDWNGTDWRNKRKDELVYNSFGQREEGWTYLGDDTNPDWSLLFHHAFYYTDPLTRIESLFSIDLNAYPNPFSDHVTLLIRSDKHIDADLKLLNMNGSVVASFPAHLLKIGQQKIELNIPHVPAGMYILSVKAGDQMNSVKIWKK